MATARKTAVIYVEVGADKKQVKLEDIQKAVKTVEGTKNAYRSEEHTSELQSHA